MTLYYYDESGDWRCDGRRSSRGEGWRQWRLHGGNRHEDGWRWRSGGDGEWRLATEELDGKVNKKINELETMVTKLQNEERKRHQEKEELQKEVAEMRTTVAELCDAECRWRWWMEWRLMNYEAMLEQRGMLKDVSEWGNHAVTNRDKLGELKSEDKRDEHVAKNHDESSGKDGELIDEDDLVKQVKTLTECVEDSVLLFRKKLGSTSNDKRKKERRRKTGFEQEP
eukprot:TRINITY_DN13906_c0_g2_i1.p2 TRINITY_DN13906_c0_g2~~TRINITY_DN13906_c0_g2_i1.p2  ORF type:complete len:254 (-),score=85.37 TRINITY_DN13906_c0_g2_i1:499-1176(-)